MKPFFYSVTVQAEDLDELNHVNNVVYFKYLQDAAISHWYSIANDQERESVRWVARKHEIEYFKSAFLGETLIIKTWIENFTAVTSERHYEIYRDDALLIKAQTLWIALNTITRKPARLSTEILNRFLE